MCNRKRNPESLESKKDATKMTLSLPTVGPNPRPFALASSQKLAAAPGPHRRPQTSTVAVRPEPMPMQRLHIQARANGTPPVGPGMKKKGREPRYEGIPMALEIDLDENQLNSFYDSQYEKQF